jgi:hypothetical protein
MSVKDTSSGTKPSAGASDAISDEEMMKLGNASLDFSDHDIVGKALTNKHQDSMMGESFAIDIDDGYTAGRGSLADAAESFKKSIEEEDLPIEEEAEEAESSAESSTPS